MSTVTSEIFEFQEDQFPIFESNQVLTSDLLNQAVWYLDDQDRESRVKLLGMGAICGFEVSKAADNSSLRLSCGVGLTSLGYLVSLPTANCTKYRVYEDPAGLTSLFEQDLGAGTAPIEVHELVDPTLPTDVDDATLADLTDNPTLLDDKVVMLYVELNDTDNKSCLGMDCDDKGLTRYINVRILIVTEDAARVIQAGTYGGSTASLDSTMNSRFDLPDVFMKRMRLVPFGTSAADFESEIKAIDSWDDLRPRFLEPLDSDFTEALGTALNDSYEAYATILSDVHGGSNPFDDASDTLSTIVSDADDYAQYVYDFCKELLEAYREFKREAFELVAACCPQTDLFPYHLFVGHTDDRYGLDACRPSVFRNAFIPSPLYNKQSEQLLRVQALHKRMAAMFERFTQENMPESVRITPSKEKLAEISDRAIPAYYFDGNDPDSSGDVVTYWNYELFKRCKSDHNLHYYADQLGAPVGIDQPLEYDHERFPFYRVEGMIGRPVESALEEIEDLIKIYSLPFHVESLKLNEYLGNIETDGKCGLSGLAEDFLISRNAFLCKLQTLMLSLPIFRDSRRDGTPSGTLEVLRKSNLQAVIDGIAADVQRVINLLPACIDDLTDAGMANFMAAYRDLMNKVYALWIYYSTLLSMVGGLSKSTGGIGLVEFSQIATIFRLISLSQLRDIVRNCEILNVMQRFRMYRWRQRLLKRQHLFSSAALREPGMEHQCGVPKGGTLFLVYEETDNGDGTFGNGTVKADFALPHPFCCCPDINVACDDDFRNFAPISQPIAANSLGSSTVEIDLMQVAFDLDGSAVRVLAQDSDPNTKLRGGINYEVDKATVTYADGFNPFDDGGYIILDSFDFVVTDHPDDGSAVPESSKSVATAFVVLINQDLGTANSDKPTSPGGIWNNWGVDNSSSVADWGFDFDFGFHIATNVDSLNTVNNYQAEVAGLEDEYSGVWQAEDDAKAAKDKLDELLGTIIIISEDPDQYINYTLGGMDDALASKAQDAITAMYNVVRSGNNTLADIESGTNTKDDEATVRATVEAAAAGYSTAVNIAMGLVKSSAQDLEKGSAYFDLMDFTVRNQLSEMTSMSNVDSAFGALMLEQDLLASNADYSTNNAGYTGIINSLGSLGM